MKKSKELIQLKKPGYHRKSFAIMKKADGKWKVFKSALTERLNSRYHSGELSYDSALEEFQRVITDLYEHRDRERQSALNTNTRLMEEYFAYKYLRKSRKRRLAESTIPGALHDLRRAVISLGQLDLSVAPIDKMQEQVDQYFEDRETNTPHSKAVCRINALLRYSGRPNHDRLETLPETFDEVKNITKEEFDLICNELVGYDHSLAMIAYHSGLRIGEIFALQKNRIRRIQNGIVLNVDKQMYRDFSYGLPKRRKIRRAFAGEACLEALNHWLEVPEEKRISLRNRKFSEIIGDSCKKANTFHKISFKDLRHCYAINLLNRGATISQVAQNLGNSEQVCRKHYVGYVMTNDGIEMMAKVVGKN